MSLRYLIGTFWYTIWFIVLPLAVSWAIVGILDRTDIIEEFEFWYVLLLFAGFAFLVYSIRDKLPFWQDRDEGGPLSTRRRRKEGKALLATVEKIVRKKEARISQRGKKDLDKATRALEEALKNGKGDAIATAMDKLDEQFDRHLSFARKSAVREYAESIGVAVLVAVLLRLFVVEAFKIPSESMVPTLMVGDHIFVSKYKYGLSLPFSNQRIVRFSKPKYGEVIVFLKPSRNEQLGLDSSHGILPEFDEGEMVGKDFIKRIVGLPGDTVEMRQDILFINGREIPRCRVGKRSYRTRDRIFDNWHDDEAELWIEHHGTFRYSIVEEPNGPKFSFGPEKVPEDQVFVLGDNRDNSNDSRFWGSVPLDNIKGRAMFIWWSNRRPHGFQWDRVGTFIMSEPAMSETQQEALARCPNMR